MALNPRNVAPGAAGANGWPRGPAPAQVGGPGVPMGRGGPGRGMEAGPPGWHQHQAMPPQWPPHLPAAGIHQQSWQQSTPGGIAMPQVQPWSPQQQMDKKAMMATHRVPLMQNPPQQPQQWGAHKVDQGTPWDATGCAGSNKEWQTPAAASWAAPPQQQPQQWVPEWQQQQQQPAQPHAGRSDQGSIGPWQQPIQQQQHTPQQQQIMGIPPQPQQWGQPPPVNHMGTAHTEPVNRGGGLDMNPGQPGPWVAPQPAEVNNDMMWHDPNPKAKRMQRDTGTALWGDPSMQMQEIRRWKDVEEDINKPSSSEWNSPQPTGWGDLPSDRWGSGGWEDSVRDPDIGQLPPGRGGPPDVNFRQPGADINQLTQQISEKLRNAVNKGFVRMELLNQPMSPEKIQMLNQLLLKVPRLEQASQELEHIRRASVPTPASKLEYERLYNEAESLRLEMAMLQSKISEAMPQVAFSDLRGGIPGVGSNAASRLQQWRKAAADESKSALDAFGGLNLDEKPTEWSTGGGSDWMCGSEVLGDIKDDIDDSADNSEVGGPREFVPGKRWEWKDPNKVAEDPNATPGSASMFGTNLMFGGWSSLVEQAWNPAQGGGRDWVTIQLAPNVGDKTVRVCANHVGAIANAFVSGTLAYVQFTDVAADQAVIKMQAELPFAQMKVVSESDLSASVSASRGGGAGWGESPKP